MITSRIVQAEISTDSFPDSLMTHPQKMSLSTSQSLLPNKLLTSNTPTVAQNRKWLQSVLHCGEKNPQVFPKRGEIAAFSCDRRCHVAYACGDH